MDEYERRAREVAITGLNAAAEFLSLENPEAFSRSHKKAQIGVAVGANYVRYLSARNNQRLLDLNEARLREALPGGRPALAGVGG